VDAKSDRKANYSINFVDSLNNEVEKISIDFENFQIFVAKESVPYIEGTEIKINEEKELIAFNPHMSITKISGTVEEQIQHVLDEEVNPMVASHGGVVSLLEVKDSSAYLEFGGGCQGCGMIDVTLKQGVEVMIKEQIPEIEAIYDVTDHAEGTNPYYQPSMK
jgi:Thioredoxin-like proteins and domains